MAIDARMAQRIKRDAPRCKFIRNLITDEIFKNNIQMPNSRWVDVYEHAVKNPETFERSFVDEQGRSDDCKVKVPPHTPGQLTAMKVPQLREIAKTCIIPGYLAMSKGELVNQIVDAQMRAAEDNEEEDDTVNKGLSDLETL